MLPSCELQSRDLTTRHLSSKPPLTHNTSILFFNFWCLHSACGQNNKGLWKGVFPALWSSASFLLWISVASHTKWIENSDCGREVVKLNWNINSCGYYSGARSYVYKTSSLEWKTWTQLRLPLITHSINLNKIWTYIFLYIWNTALIFTL